MPVASITPPPSTLLVLAAHKHIHSKSELENARCVYSSRAFLLYTPIIYKFPKPGHTNTNTHWHDGTAVLTYSSESYTRVLAPLCGYIHIAMMGGLGVQFEGG